MAHTTESGLSDRQRDIARRAGRVAAIIALSKIIPSALHRFPPWAQKCLDNLAEAGAQDARDAVGDMTSPAGLGFSLGACAMLTRWVHRPDERWGHSVREFLEAYFASYVEAIKQETGQDMPPNFWPDFVQAIFAAFVGYEHAGRREFHRGLGIALDAEQNYLEGSTRETTATPVYAELLLFMPEILAMKNLGEVYRFLVGRFSDSPGVLGDFERFRRAANRIELSFKDQIP